MFETTDSSLYTRPARSFPGRPCAGGLVNILGGFAGMRRPATASAWTDRTQPAVATLADRPKDKREADVGKGSVLTECDAYAYTRVKKVMRDTKEHEDAVARRCA